MISEDQLMKIAIIGSRNYPKLEKIDQFVADLHEKYSDRLVIVSGGAKGVDTAATDAATNIGVQTEIWWPDWNKHGRKAGMLRNHDIVRSAAKVVAFWDLVSRGSAHTMGLAKQQNKLWKVFGPEGEELTVADLNIG